MTIQHIHGSLHVIHAFGTTRTKLDSQRFPVVALPLFNALIVI